MIIVPLIFASMVTVAPPQGISGSYPYMAECYFVNQFNGGGFYDDDESEWVYCMYQVNMTTYLNYDSNSNYQFTYVNFEVSLEYYDFGTDINGSYHFNYTDDEFLTNTYDGLNFFFSCTGYDDGFQFKIGYDNAFIDTRYFDIGNGSDYIGYDYSLYRGYLESQVNDFLYSVNHRSSYDEGYNDGYYTGYDNGLTDGNTQGYQSGYNDGYTEGATQDETAVAIFSGIISVGLIPINFFLACLNFEVFGINIGAFVSALLTIAIVVIITRMIVSGGNGGGDK